MAACAQDGFHIPVFYMPADSNPHAGKLHKLHEEKPENGYGFGGTGGGYIIYFFLSRSVRLPGENKICKSGAGVVPDMALCIER